MVDFKGKFVIVVCVVISVFTTGISEITMESKKIFINYNTSLLVDRSSFSSPGMVFGFCSDASIAKNRFCTLFLETTEPVDSPGHLRVCNITLKSKTRYEEIRDIDNVVAFGENKAILVWSNQDLSKSFTIVHFSDCRTYVSKIDNDVILKLGRVVATEDDIFDVIEKNDERSSCKQSDFCKLTLDDRGNMVTGFTAWGKKKLQDTLIDVAFSPFKGRLIVDANSWMTRIRVVQEKDFHALKKFNNFYRRRMLLRPPTTSKTHGLLTVCYEYNFSSFLCTQFDLNGSIKFEISMYIHTTLESSITVHNLPGGGFLLLDGAFYNENVFCKNCFTVSKIGADGREVGYKDFVFVFPYKYRFDFREVHFHINDNGKYCLSHPYEFGDNLPLSLTIVCFEDADLIY